MIDYRQRILFVAPSAYHLGGLATWLDYLLPALRTRGWRAILGLVEGARHHQPDRYLEEHPDSDVVTIRCRTGTATGRSLALKQVISRLSPDLVVSVNIPECITAAAESSSRSVIACHGIQADLFEDMALLRDSLDGAVCTNKLACQLATDLGTLPPGKVYYGPCGTEVPDEMISLRKTLTPTLAYVGRIEQSQKRITDMVDILCELRRSQVHPQLLVAGTGPDESLLRSRIAEHELQNHVRFLGTVPAKQLRTQVFEKTDALLLTSEWETGPLVIWEAMAHGLPVVTSQYTGSIAEGALIDGQNCQIFPVGNPKAASEKIIELIRSPEKGEMLRRSARQLVQARYRIEDSVHHWETAFRSLLSAPKQSFCGSKSLTTANFGRLNKILPSGLAERLRHLLRRLGPDCGPGGEWPHSIASVKTDTQPFWNIVKELESSPACTPN